MEYLKVKEIADKWGVSDRTIRNYCSNGMISGAIIIGKTWHIPKDAKNPRKKDNKFNLLEKLIDEKNSNIKGGIYHKIQIDLTYNSNHIEGSKLSHDETRYIYETNTIISNKRVLNVDDIVETVNHFKCIDLVIDNANHKLSESFIKKLHFILKNGTSDSKKDWFVVGDYKRFPNEVGGNVTTDPSKVKHDIKKILKYYNEKENITLNEILDFHYRFEKIHPFQDGNGRVGRLIMFKECLKHNIVPFIIDEELKIYYYRGLNEWKNEKGFLTETALRGQDKFIEVLKYFKINS